MPAVNFFRAAPRLQESIETTELPSEDARRASRLDVVVPIGDSQTPRSEYDSTISYSSIAEDGYKGPLSGRWKLTSNHSGANDEIKLGEVLGKGGYGTVYTGTWRGEHVAVKVLTHENWNAVPLLEKEALLGMLLSHPNIVQHLHTRHVNYSNGKLVMNLGLNNTPCSSWSDHNLHLSRSQMRHCSSLVGTRSPLISRLGSSTSPSAASFGAAVRKYSIYSTSNTTADPRRSVTSMEGIPGSAASWRASDSCLVPDADGMGALNLPVLSSHIPECLMWLVQGGEEPPPFNRNLHPHVHAYPGVPHARFSTGMINAHKHCTERAPHRLSLDRANGVASASQIVHDSFASPLGHLAPMGQRDLGNAVAPSRSNLQQLASAGSSKMQLLNAFLDALPLPNEGNHPDLWHELHASSYLDSVDNTPLRPDCINRDVSISAGRIAELQEASAQEDLTEASIRIELLAESNVIQKPAMDSSAVRQFTATAPRTDPVTGISKPSTESLKLWPLASTHCGPMAAGVDTTLNADATLVTATSEANPRQLFFEQVCAKLLALPDSSCVDDGQQPERGCLVRGHSGALFAANNAIAHLIKPAPPYDPDRPLCHRTASIDSITPTQHLFGSPGAFQSAYASNDGSYSDGTSATAIFFDPPISAIDDAPEDQPRINSATQRHPTSHKALSCGGHVRTPTSTLASSQASFPHTAIIQTLSPTPVRARSSASSIILGPTDTLTGSPHVSATSHVQPGPDDEDVDITVRHYADVASYLDPEEAECYVHSSSASSTSNTPPVMPGSNMAHSAKAKPSSHALHRTISAVSLDLNARVHDCLLVCHSTRVSQASSVLSRVSCTAFLTSHAGSSSPLHRASSTASRFSTVSIASSSRCSCRRGSCPCDIHMPVLCSVLPFTGNIILDTPHDRQPTIFRGSCAHTLAQGHEHTAGCTPPHRSVSRCGRLHQSVSGHESGVPNSCGTSMKDLLRLDANMQRLFSERSDDTAESSPSCMSPSAVATMQHSDLLMAARGRSYTSMQVPARVAHLQVCTGLGRMERRSTMEWQLEEDARLRQEEPHTADARWHSDFEFGHGKGGVSPSVSVPGGLVERCPEGQNNARQAGAGFSLNSGSNLTDKSSPMWLLLPPSGGYDADQATEGTSPAAAQHPTPCSSLNTPLPSPNCTSFLQADAPTASSCRHSNQFNNIAPASSPVSADSVEALAIKQHPLQSAQRVHKHVAMQVCASSHTSVLSMGDWSSQAVKHQNSSKLPSFRQHQALLSRDGEDHGVVMSNRTSVVDIAALLSDSDSEEGDGEACNERELQDTMMNLLHEARQSILETWIVQEYCDQGCLATALFQKRFVKPPGVMPEVHAILLRLCDVAQGMIYLHNLQICHGDLTCNNVLLKHSSSDPYNCVAKVTDFGLCHVMRSHPRRSHSCTELQGTVNYLAPELALLGHISPAVDVYAFGIIMWEVFTSGLPAYPGLHPAEIRIQVGKNNLRPMFPSHTPSPYLHLAERCWSGAACKRPSFVEVLQELQDMVAKAPQLQRAMEDQLHDLCQWLSIF